LSSSPPSTYLPDYDAWVIERNENAPHLPPVTRGNTIIHKLAIRWNLVLEIARGDLSLADVQAERLAHLTSKGEDFGSVAVIALLHGISTTHAGFITKRDAFPAFAFKLQATRVWHLADILAHHAGEPFPERVPEELQQDILDSKQIRNLCGLTTSEMDYAVYTRKGNIPHPSGYVGGYHYWWRHDVERWATENPELAKGCSIDSLYSLDSGYKQDARWRLRVGA
jgi:hypothetical protein